MNEQVAKDIGYRIGSILTDEKEDVISANIDGSESPPKFTIKYADENRDITELKTELSDLNT
jgi:hypothetical protein